MAEASKIQAVDPFGVADIFVSGLAEVEDIGGGCYRFLFFAKQHVGDVEEWVVVAKLVAPLEAIPPAVIKTAKTIGMSMALEFPKRRMN